MCYQFSLILKKKIAIIIMKNDKHHATKEVDNRETFNLPKDDIDTLDGNTVDSYVQL